MEPSPWIFRCTRSVNCASPHVRLFCFSYAGGSARTFTPWAEQLPASIELCPVQMPGRENRIHEAPLRRLEPLLEGLSEVLANHDDTPFAFFGHSLGAHVAYELALHLRRLGRPGPFRLFLSAAPAPRLMPAVRSRHRLPDAEFLEYVTGFGGLPDALSRRPKWLAHVLPLLRADLELGNTIAFAADEPPLDCSMYLLGGLSDPCVSLADLEGWREHTSGGASLRLFDGDHLFLQRPRNKLPLYIARHLLDRVRFRLM
jgi:medium-chain acyl-[acyl-carrier-protein] hydrolase